MKTDECIELLQGIMYAFCDECDAVQKEQCDKCEELKALNKACEVLKATEQDAVEK